jgi:hypothetical protein
MQLGGAVINAERADFAERAGDDRVLSSVIPSPPGICMLRSTTRQMTATPLGPVQRKQITQDERRF